MSTPISGYANPTIHDMKFGDFIVFVDESGDHSLESINPEFPLFVLAFCVVSKDDYIKYAVPLLQAIKFKHFGHDQVVLHEHDIRKRKGPFSILMREDRRNVFMGDMNQLMASFPFTILATVIKKDLHRARYREPQNPYHLSMQFGLERLKALLKTKGQEKHLTYIIVESRGHK